MGTTTLSDTPDGNRLIHAPYAARDYPQNLYTKSEQEVPIAQFEQNTTGIIGDAVAGFIEDVGQRIVRITTIHPKANQNN